MSVLLIAESCFKYGDNTVLRSVNFRTTPGIVHGIIGPNGSGKTTLLKGMAGLIHPCSGSIFLDGEDIRKYKSSEVARNIAMVPQNAALPELFTVLDIVLMGRTPHLGFLRYESRKDISIAMHAMEVVQISHLADKRINELSGGERQRAIIARTLAQEANILLLDEPTANLDISYQIEILNLLRQLCRSNKMTVVAALHDLNLASQYCDLLTMLKDGRIFKQGVPEDIINASSIHEVFGIDIHVSRHPVNGLPAALITSQNSIDKR